MQNKTLVELLLGVSQDDDRGILFIKAPNNEQFLSYRELFLAAQNVAGFLTNLQVPARKEIILFVNEEIDFIKLFWGCILADCVPVPISAGPQKGNREKCIAVFNKLDEPLIIADKTSCDFIYRSARNNPELHAKLVARSLLVDGFFSGDILHYKMVIPSENDVAFIQFTSGSTGNPKGVMLSHRNLITNVNDIHHVINSTSTVEQYKILSWMPLTHDMGLIGFHLVPLAAGWTHYIMPTSLFAKRPLMWLESISKYRISITGSPNFGFQHAVNALRRLKEPKSFELSSLKIIINGAEQISLMACRNFIAETARYHLNPNVFSPVYGLAEASLAVTMSQPLQGLDGIFIDRTKTGIGDAVDLLRADDPKATWFAYVGSKIPNCDYKIIDVKGNDLPDGMVGEVVIMGENVTKGYYHNGDSIFPASVKSGWLPTGDLGFISDGKLVITGRIKNLIILNGQNYYPHDIERTICKYLGVEESIVFACAVKDNNLLEELVVFIKKSFRSTIQLIKFESQVRNLLSEHFGINVKEVLQLDHVPRTSSGKVQYEKLADSFQGGAFNDAIFMIKKLKEAQRASSPNSVGSANGDEILRMVRQVIGKDVQLNDNLFDYGLNSIIASQITFEINRNLNANLAANHIFENPTVNDLEGFVSKNNSRQLPAIENVPDVNQFETNQRQRKFWFFDQIGLKQSNYIIGGAVKTTMRMDASVLEIAIGEVLNRHTLLRSRFVVSNDILNCVIENYDAQPTLIRFSYLRIESSSETAIEVVDKFMFGRFDLANGPLFRVAHFSFSDADVLALSVHHIVCDGWSMMLIGSDISVVIKELSEGRKFNLKPIEFQFHDFVLWERRLQQSRNFIEQHRDFWRKELEGDLEKVNLPFMRRNRTVQPERYENISCVISGEELSAIDGCSRNNRVTPFVVCMSLIGRLIHDYTRQEDILIGTDFSGRTMSAFNNMVGYFLNTVALRFRIAESMSFDKLVKSVDRKIRECSEHQLYAFETILKDLGLDYDDNLFNVFVLYRDFDGRLNMQRSLPEYQLELMPSNHVGAFGDLQLEFIRDGDRLYLNVSFDSNVIPEVDMIVFIQRYRDLIRLNCNLTSTAYVSR